MFSFNKEVINTLIQTCVIYLFIFFYCSIIWGVRWLFVLLILVNLLTIKLSFSFYNTLIQNDSPLNNYICLSYLRLIISHTSRLKDCLSNKSSFCTFWFYFEKTKTIDHTNIDHCILWVINSEISGMLTYIQHISRQELLLIVVFFSTGENNMFGFPH